MTRQTWWTVGLLLAFAACPAPVPGADAGASDAGAADAGAQDAGPSDAGRACLTCAAAGFECGFLADGCGATLACGACANGQTCGGDGVAGRCGQAVCGIPCIPLNCLQRGVECGPTPDGCGGLLRCGACREHETCGGGGVPGQCGAPVPDGGCSATCAQLGCGLRTDACGVVHDCGPCADAGCGQPASCLRDGRACGAVPGACGGDLDCGGCYARGARCVEDDAGAHCEYADGGADGGCP